MSAARGLPAARFESSICCLEARGALVDEAERAGVLVFCLGRLPGLRHPVAFVRLIRVIRSARPTIVHTHLQSANLYGRLAAWLAGVPVIVATEHNVYVGKARRYVAVERLLARITDCLIAVSTEVQQFLGAQLRLPESSIRVVNNGVAAHSPSPERVGEVRARLRSDERGREGSAPGVWLGVVASLTPKKGHEYLLRAVAGIRGRGFACSLVLAGDGPERRRLETLTEELGLGGSVQFLGAVMDSAAVLDVIDVFVLPSLREGLPLALLEAMLAGKPVIATSVGGVPEVVQSGVNGLLVAPGRADELGRAIEMLLGSPELRSRLGAQARKTVESGFTEAAYLESLAGIYTELTSRKQAHAAGRFRATHRQ